MSVFGVFLVRTLSECGKVRTRKTPDTANFYAANVSQCSVEISWNQFRKTWANNRISILKNSSITSVLLPEYNLFLSLKNVKIWKHFVTNMSILKNNSAWKFNVNFLSMLTAVPRSWLGSLFCFMNQIVTFGVIIWIFFVSASLWMFCYSDDNICFKIFSCEFSFVE